MTFFAQLSKLIDDYNANSIKTAIIQHWAKYSGIKLNVFKSNSITQKFLEKTNEKEVSFLINQFRVLFPEVTIKDIEKLFV